MTIYTGVSAYGTNPNAGKSPNGAATRGWGSGWPNCQTTKMVRVTNGDHFVNVRREIAQLVLTLFKITAVRGYDVNPAGQMNQTWGFACRAIANTSIASNHSWGLAIDINAPSNWYSTTFHSNIPPAVVNAWEVCGFYWGGRYTKKFDTMHFEYIGRPEDVAGHLAKALAILKSLTPTTPPVQPPEKKYTMTEFTETQLKAIAKEGAAAAIRDLYTLEKNGTAAKNHQEMENLVRGLIKQEADRYIVYYNNLRSILAAVAADDSNDVTQADVDEILAKMEELKPEVPPVPNP